VFPRHAGASFGVLANKNIKIDLYFQYSNRKLSIMLIYQAIVLSRQRDVNKDTLYLLQNNKKNDIISNDFTYRFMIVTYRIKNHIHRKHLKENEKSISQIFIR